MSISHFTSWLGCRCCVYFAHHNRILNSGKKKKENLYLKAQDPIPEPDLWFHDIFRIDGTAYDSKEIEIITSYTK